MYTLHSIHTHAYKNLTINHKQYYSCSTFQSFWSYKTLMILLLNPFWSSQFNFYLKLQRNVVLPHNTAELQCKYEWTKLDLVLSKLNWNNAESKRKDEKIEACKHGFLF